MTDTEIVQVVEARRDGSRIQFRRRYHENGPWEDTDSKPQWDFIRFDYRVKPEPPKPREWWIYPVDGNLSCSIEGSPTAGFVHVREVMEGQ